MVKKIATLTAGQEALIPQWRDKWLAIGTATSPIDRIQAVDYGSRLMEHMGREHACTIVMASPLSAWLAVCLLCRANTAQVGDQVGAQVRDQVWAQVGAQVGAQVWAQVGAQVRDQVWAQVGAQVRDQVWAQVWAQVGDQVWAQVGDQVGDQVPRFVWPWLGCWDICGWAAFISFFEEVAGCDLPDWSLIKDHCCLGPVWPLKNFVVISDRPSVLHMQDGRLHCEVGPAWSFRDGLCGYSIGGVRVDEQIAMRPNTQSIKQIDGEENAEVKRIRIDRYGWEKYLTKKNATVLEHRRNDIEGTDESLMQCDDMVVLVGACPSTGRIYAMEVEPGIETCQQAQNYLSSGKSTQMIGAS